MTVRGALLRALALAALISGMMPSSAPAQELATLVADVVTVSPEGRLTASGDVEIAYDGTRLTAESIVYDRSSDRLTIGGPITLIEPGGTVLLARQAELSGDLQEGILTSARLVLDRQLQLAAEQVLRADGRYTELRRTVASSCEVCAENPTPLWEIRAERVISDDVERQLYFENAQVRVAGLPILWLPRLRLPGPGLERSTGVLFPLFTQTSDLGFGVRLPYFIPVGDHADITLTPYVSPQTRTLEVRLRQELRFGAFSAEGALTNDDLEGTRQYLFADAVAFLPRGFRADLSLELASDPGYLSTYGYGENDRLENELRLSRVRDKDTSLARVIDFRTLRDAEIAEEDELPETLAELVYTREIPALAFGGQTFASVRSAALRRESDVDGDGRDTARLGAALDWRRDWIGRGGLVYAAELGLSADGWSVADDSSFDDRLTRQSARAAAELRWPVRRVTADGGSELLEPVIRLDMAKVRGDTPPNEDSLVVEFDEGNLFAPTRYPGVDRVEDGVRLAFGAAWQRVDPSGWRADFAAGRVVRLDGDLPFAEGSGLAGDRSEWLVSLRFAKGDDLWITSRSLFDEKLRPTLSETRFDWRTADFDVASSYLYAEPEPAEGRTSRLSEVSFDGSTGLTDAWRASAGVRYDLNADRASRARLGLDYEGDCVSVGLSVSRRFASSTSVSPSTDFGLRVQLAGIGGEERRPERRSGCRG